MKHFTAVLSREDKLTTEIIGTFKLYDDTGAVIFSCVTLELPYKNNERRVSSIPVGIYKCKPHNSKKYPNTFEVLGVPDRTAILLHWGNFNYNTHGCILLGKDVVDINGDGVLDITSSKPTFRKFHHAVNSSQLTLNVVEEYE